MNYLRTLLSIAGLCMSVATANAQDVAPGQLFPGQLLNIKAPDSVGWKLLKASPTGMNFYRSGNAANESYVAMVRAFKLPETANQAEFVALVEKGFEALPKQFEVLKAKHEYVAERGYPCARTAALLKDTQAFSGRESLNIQWYALICRHPYQRDLGFEISFSHRGGALDSNLEREAIAFAQGVQVTDK